MSKARDLWLDNWPIRRRVVFAVLGFVAGVIVWLVVRGEDTALNRSIAESLIWAGTATVLGYVFGAVADDWDKRKSAASAKKSGVLEEEE